MNVNVGMGVVVELLGGVVGGGGGLHGTGSNFTCSTIHRYKKLLGYYCSHMQSFVSFIVYQEQTCSQVFELL